MKVLVVGHKGMLGSDMMLLYPGRCEVYGADCDEVDITNPASIDACVASRKPDVVINAAAYTNVDGAESDEAKATAVNGPGAGNVARAAVKIGARTVHISTDYVFDGSKIGAYVETDPTGPTNAYGRSKLAGEAEVLGADPRGLIVRTAWLYGVHGKNFVETILKLASERDLLTVVNDQRGSPTWTRDLADAMMNLIDAKASGIYHVTNSGVTTWFDFARRIVELGGFSKTKVDPMSSDKLNRAAKRPANSALDGSKYAALIGKPTPRWEDALDKYMKARPKNV